MLAQLSECEICVHLHHNAGISMGQNRLYCRYQWDKTEKYLLLHSHKLFLCSMAQQKPEAELGKELSGCSLESREDHIKAIFNIIEKT